jgi:hypothetical protein
MMFATRRFTALPRRGTAAPAFAASSVTVPMRILSAAIAAWALLPIAASGQERVPNQIRPDANRTDSHVTRSAVITSMSATTDAAAVITSVGLDPGAATVDFSTSSPDGFAVFDAVSGSISGFPTEGSSFFVISTGATSSALLPNDSEGTSTELEGLNTSLGEDLVTISFVMTPPAGAACLSFDFKFFSEEFPEFVNQGYNDTFLAEKSASTFTIEAGKAIAPNNVAFDSGGNPITVDTVLGVDALNAVGTTYDGATATLSTDAPFEVDALGNLTMVFSIMDLGDSVWDSTAFLDNFRWGDESCEPITEPAPEPEPPPPPGAQPYGLVWVYHSASDDGTPGCFPNAPPCGISGGPGDRINLWIDGGSSEGNGDVCKMGSGGNTGDALCGADILIEMTNGRFTGIEPTIDTLVCNPSCADCGEGGCALPDGTTRIRMNFRRGSAAPSAVRRRVATLIVDSSLSTGDHPTQVFATGVGAVGAKLQRRPIAGAYKDCTAAGEPFSCCESATAHDDRWPCGPQLIAPALLPEPGQLWQLMSGLAGLGCLYRLRRRC